MGKEGRQAATSCDPDEVYLRRLGILSVDSEENVVVRSVCIALLAACRGRYGKQGGGEDDSRMAQEEHRGTICS